MEYLKVGNIKAYQISSTLGNQIWKKISLWSYFEKDTVGKQFTRSVDSIAANIAEGFGRHHKKDKIKFFYQSRGSVYESLHWLKVSFDRNLVSEKDYKEILQKLCLVPKEINFLIKITRQKLSD